MQGFIQNRWGRSQPAFKSTSLLHIIATFGLDLIYNEKPDATLTALYAVAIGASYPEGRKMMNESL